MSAREPGPNQLEFQSQIRKRRSGKLEQLMSSVQGREAIDSMVYFIANGASGVAAAARIGIAPNTLSKWFMKGRVDDDGPYRELWDRVVVAIGQVAAECEVELRQQDPKFYLQNGMGKSLLGNIYNTDPNDLTQQIGLDGTVTNQGIENPTAIRHDDSEQDITSEQLISEERKQDRDNQLLLEALEAYRDAGIDVNDIVDSMINKKNKQKVIGADDPITNSDACSNNRHVE